MNDSLRAVLQKRLAQLQSAGQDRPRRTVQSLPQGRCRCDGRTLISFGSNDYLGLTHHPDVRAAFADAAGRQAGSGSSALITGRSDEHAALEAELAEFEHSEAALLFPSGYAANAGTLQALIGPEDVIFSERDNHASLIDGCRLTRAAVHLFTRHDLPQLRQILSTHRNQGRQAFLITDGVFSMDGTVAPLARLCSLAEEFDAALIVDEAHGTGVVGAEGRGACELENVCGRVFLRIVTLSKALGGLGGAVVGDAPTIAWLWNRARPQFFSTALPPAVCAAVRASLKIVRAEPERRRRLQKLTQQAREIVRDAGLTVLADGPAPIIPLQAPAGCRIRETVDCLMDAGWFLPGIVPPTVPPGTERFRMSLTSDHQVDEVRAVIECLASHMRPDGKSRSRPPSRTP